MDLKQFWQACDDVFGQEAVAAEWLQSLGGDEATWQWAFDQGLVRATGELAMAYPKLEAVPLSPLAYDVICHDEDADDYVGVCPDGTGKRRLTREELRLYALDRRRLCAALAAALGLTRDYRELDGVRYAWCVGGYQPLDDAEAWVYLSLPSGREDLTEAAVRMVALHPAPFLVLTPTERWWGAWPDGLRHRGRVVAMADLLAAGPPGGGLLTARTTMTGLLDRLFPRSQAAAATCRAANTAVQPSFRRQGAGWVIIFAGQTVAMPDLVGFGYVAQLLARPGERVHAATLQALTSGRADAAKRADDRGQPALDSRAWREIKERVEELHRELEEATEFNDLARKEAAQEELRRLAAAQLQAKAKGRRDRRIGSGAENARKAVGNAIERVLTELQPHHLDTSIMRGENLIYQPSAPVDWQL